MGKSPPFAEGSEPTIALSVDQAEEIVYDNPFDPTKSGQLLLWEAIKIVPVPDGPIVSEK